MMIFGGRQEAELRSGGHWSLPIINYWCWGKINIWLHLLGTRTAAFSGTTQEIHQNLLLS